MLGEEILYAALTAGSPANEVVALVGTVIYPVIVPEGKPLPAIAYQRVNTEPVNTISGNAWAARVTFDVFCVAAQFPQADSLASSVRRVMAVNKAIEWTNKAHSYDADSGAYAVSLTYEFYEKEE
jgi:Protein of unknown function (DUF3168)